MSRKQKSFEDKLAELENTVSELEDGELSLDEAIKRFESGQKLHRELTETLAGYEKRIEKLVGSAEDSADDAPDEDEDEGDEFPF